ncbi:MAG: cation transporter [Bacteroidia bacterium]|jgi:divalent metal cation (Fe/Co/Zn/Cd) transporter|nr:cation transporter [Bacteroidia bacterium]
METTTQGINTQQLFKTAFGLAIFTIVYNIVEGLVSTLLGFSDESLALFGFGADSFIETISGVGILHMVARIRANPNSNRDQYERTALKITGFSFFALVLALTATAVFNIVTDQEPETTFWGIVISIISISIMWVLVVYKRKIGKLLNSEAILADAECTKVCIYMSLVLLVSSGLYYFVKLPYIDSVGALILAYLSFREGRECFEKAKSDKYCACEHN